MSQMVAAVQNEVYYHYGFTRTGDVLKAVVIYFFVFGNILFLVILYTYKFV